MRLGTGDGRREIEDRRCEKGYVRPEARDLRQETGDKRSETGEKRGKM